MPFSEELKQYRGKEGLTQREMGQLLGISQRMYAYYESGEFDQSPVKISKYRKILYSKKDENKEKKNEINSISRQPHSNATLVDMGTMQIMWVPLVDERAKAGYLSGFSDKEYMGTLTKIPFTVDKEYKGDYVAFTVSGDSMDDGTVRSYPNGSIVLAREVGRQHWRDKLHIHKWRFVIVHKTKGVIIKEIKKHVKETGVITCHSYNDLYEDFDINLDDVEQLFNVVKVLRDET